MNIERGTRTAMLRATSRFSLWFIAPFLFAAGVSWVSAGAAAAYNNPHGPYSVASDQCATCHRTHADSHETFNNITPTSHSVDCLVCHDGTGASTNVSAEYVAAGVAVNVPSTRSYYTHDAKAVSTGHIAAASDVDGNSIAANEFGGVSNRHSDCVDCHNPHAASTVARPVQRLVAGSFTGWSASGDLQMVSVVSRISGTNVFVPGASTSTNFEYELCLKCHSGFTVLGSNTGQPSSRYWLDKAQEIDSTTVGNTSFHPIRSKGTNATTIMRANLADTTSTMHKWTFTETSTVRCTNCHSSKADTSTALSQPVHATPNRGMLLAKYEDRTLSAANDGFVAANFALCFACHSTEPFTNANSAKTAFGRHLLHVANLQNKGSGAGGIDTPKAGVGNALCAECHFRIHSTKYTNTTPAQQLTGGRLVNFSPNVETATGTTIIWNGTPAAGSRTCTLRCHGFSHNAERY